MTTPIILPFHFNGQDTIIYNGWVMNGCQFFHMDDAQEVLKEHAVPNHIWQQVLDAKPNGVTTSVDLPTFAFTYCRVASNDAAMRQVILDSADAMRAYGYCRDVSNDPDMRQVIIDSGNAIHAHMYCREISNDSDMRQVIIDSGDDMQCFEYCCDVSNDSDMRQVIINGGNTELASLYRYWVSNDADMMVIAEK